MTNATSEKSRCPRCGRNYLKGLTDCYNCINNERYAKRSGRKLSSASEKYAPSRKAKWQKPASKSISKQLLSASPPKTARPKRKSNRTRVRRKVTTDSLPILPIDGASIPIPRSRKPFSLKHRAEGFNRLARDVYLREMTTSKILQQGGYSQEHIDSLKTEPQKLSRLYEQIETKIYAMLRTQFPNLDPSVLNIWYGLHTHRNATHQAIASQLNITIDDVAATRIAYLKYLRTPSTIATLEQLIRQAAFQVSS